MTKLANNNELTQLETGIWVKANADDRSFIDYTDGSSTEELVYARVEAAKDRSVYSGELDQNWSEWALEYHLGSKRSNIYRGLNLAGIKTVLEVGCGCGAITRFLGEQGFEVDAIEGTMHRAEIARLRTQDLDNVHIVSSNYHELVLGEKSYDLVVFTGVLEYSGAYAPEGISPEAQLATTLQHAKGALSDSGQILIAIENRTGFKYLAGASEDHLNVPDIGLLGYPELKTGDITRGIRTWSKKQWSAMLDDLAFAAYEFCYPFPDYKVPDAILSEHFLVNSDHPEQVLGGIRSRDYFTIWQPKLDESLFWKTAAQTGSMDEYANSFLIVLGQNKAVIKQTIDFDFVRFASTRRKLPYRLQITKKQNEAIVRRIRVMTDDQSADEQGIVSQTPPQQEQFVDGQILEQIWFDQLKLMSSSDEVDDCLKAYDALSLHIQTYSTWLAPLIKQDANTYVDALPQNIIVDGQGSWHLIDQEWRAKQPISQAIILSRALYYFANSARGLFADIELAMLVHPGATKKAKQDLPATNTVQGFVRWGMAQAGLDYDDSSKAFLEFENALQTQVSRLGFTRLANVMLDATLQNGNFRKTLNQYPTSMQVRAFWTQVEGVWHIDHSVEAQVTFDQGYTLELTLPEMLKTHRYLRIDPVADLLPVFQAGLKLAKLSIVVDQGGQQQTVFDISSTQALFESAKLKGVHQISPDSMLFESEDAQIVLDLNEINWVENTGSIKLLLAIELTQQISYFRAKQFIQSDLLRSVSRIRFRQKMLDRQHERITEANETLKEVKRNIVQQLQRQTERQQRGGMLGKLLRLIGR